MAILLELKPIAAEEPARAWVNRWTLKGSTRWSDRCGGCGQDHRLAARPDIVVDTCTVFPSRELAEECAARITAARRNVIHLGAEPLN